MPEDAGKKRFIKDFLVQIAKGTGYIENIWVERNVYPPATTTGEVTKAKSLSGRAISNLTELLEDDIRYGLDEGYFVFRFVSATYGSGKTAFINYFDELLKNKKDYQNRLILVRFSLADIITMGGSQTFNVKLYCYILAQFFWNCLYNPAFSLLIKEKAKNILKEIFTEDQFNSFKDNSNFKNVFLPKFYKYFSEVGIIFEDFLLHIIDEISEVSPIFSFICLIDELDSLRKHPEAFKYTRTVFRGLVDKVFSEKDSKLRLIVYLVGTSDDVKEFIHEDGALKSRISDSIINFAPGLKHEISLIKAKIDERVYQAYKGYKNFPQAWKEIQEIPLNPANTLRNFCQSYASSVLEIHEKYFQEAPEQKFEGDARQLVEAECRKYWGSYLKKSSYSLSKTSTTKVLANHAFDCYVELLHNGVPVARAFGEAKNYELLSGHLQTFEKWLEDANCQLTSSQEHPPDLAFMIAPSCPTLLKRKLQLKNIHFIQADKPVVRPEPDPTPKPVGKPISVVDEPVNINTASKEELINAFKGAGMKKNTIDLLIEQRQKKRYTNLSQLISDLKSTTNVKNKLQEKLNQGIICF